MPDRIEIVADTETTGTDKTNDRICEIGCVEIKNFLPTGRTFHAYIDPKKRMPIEAENVHGLSDAFLKGKPVFRQIASEFLEFIGDRPLVAHNASFDIGFLNAELNRIGRDKLTNEVIDTLSLARKQRPGKKNGLDVLCKEFGVDTSRRVKHGALIDSEMLAEVYLHLQGGLQQPLAFDLTKSDGLDKKELHKEPVRFKNKRRITPEEFERHKAFVRSMGPSAIWLEHEIYARHLRLEPKDAHD